MGSIVNAACNLYDGLFKQADMMKGVLLVMPAAAYSAAQELMPENSPAGQAAEQTKELFSKAAELASDTVSAADEYLTEKGKAAAEFLEENKGAVTIYKMAAGLLSAETVLNTQNKDVENISEFGHNIRKFFSDLFTSGK